MGNTPGAARPNRAAALILIVLALVACYVAWLAAGAPDVPSETRSPTGTALPGGPQPTRTLRPTRTPRPGRTAKVGPSPTPTLRPAGLPKKKVGIVAGHYKYDSGAVCPDGLQEAGINLDVASRVVAILQSEGYDAELLSEFDDKLSDYQADAFVSIHSDSCVVPGVSGFKVARVAGSAIPEEEDRLVQCMVNEYQEATHLAFHEDSITYDMTSYHAFHEIDPLTPAIIIELGFMGADRSLLTGHSYELAQGIAHGVKCFLEKP